MYNDDCYYKVVKLKTNEVILCSMTADIRSQATISFITMINPIQVFPFQEMRKGNEIAGESFTLRPWIGLSDSDEFVVNADIVLTIGDLKRDVRDKYIEYVTHMQTARQYLLDEEERSDAADSLLRELNFGKLHIIDEPPHIHRDYYGNEEGR